MLKKSGYNEKLKELMNAKKADNSILETIKNNENEYEKAKANLEKLEKELEQIEERIEEKRMIKAQTPFYKVKDFSQILKDLNTVKKEYKQKLDEKEYLEIFCEEKLMQNSEIEKDIEKQYTIYQENEIYIKAVEKITENNIELATDFYANYVNHINQYMNSVYSIENNVKLAEPNASDLATLLSILQKLDEKKSKNKKKTATRKRATKTESKEEAPAEEKKKTTRRKSAKTENKEESAEEKKTATRKKSTKTENKEEAPVEEKKTATRKSATKTENKEEATAEEKKTATRKRATKTENKEEAPVEEKKTTTRKKGAKTESEKETSAEEKKTTTRKKTTKKESDNQ